MRSVVSGKVINVYSENDYILAFLYRATSIQFGVAGLQEIGDVEGVDNLNLSKEVSGHLRYPDLIGKILKKSGFEGVLVEDMDIERDVSEIQLRDAESGDVEMDGTWNAKSGYEGDLLGLMDSQPPPAELEAADRGLDELTRGMAGIDMTGMRTSTNAQPDPPPRSNSQQIEIDRERGVMDITQVLAGVNLEDQHVHQDRRYDDSDSDAGGIQMIDNDSDSYDGELQEVPGVPIPDDYNDPHDEPRDMGKVAMFEEQKSLGSFPRERGGGSSPGVESPGSASAAGGQRRTAADMGLY